MLDVLWVCDGDLLCEGKMIVEFDLKVLVGCDVVFDLIV